MLWHLLRPFLSKEMRHCAVEVLSVWWGQLAQTCLLPLEARDSHPQAEEGGGAQVPELAMHTPSPGRPHPVVWEAWH